MEVCFSMINKIEMREIPTISEDEKEVLVKIQKENFTGGRKRLWELPNEDVKLLGSFMAKYHLKRILEYIYNSEQRLFVVDFFCDNLRLSIAENHKICVSLKNYGFSDNTMYRLGYRQVIDSYFNAPIVEKAFGPLTYRFVFEVK